MRRAKWMLGAAMAAVLTITAGSAQAFPPAQGESELVAAYDFYAAETPENVVVNFQNDVFITLALTGVIEKVNPNNGDREVYAQLPILGPNGEVECGFVAMIAGLALNPITNDLYVTVNSCTPENRGIWKVSPDGSMSVIATVPMDAMLNGIVMRGLYLYTVDSMSVTGRIFSTRIDQQGAEAEVFLESDLMAFDPTLPPPEGVPFMPGMNGIQKYMGDLYVSNSGKNAIYRIPMVGSGLNPFKPPRAGEPEWYVDALGADDFAFDWQGNIYFTNDPYSQLVKVTPDNEATVLLDSSDGMDGSTACAFGRLGLRKVIYVTSASFPFMPDELRNETPSIIAYGNDIAGYPMK